MTGNRTCNVGFVFALREEAKPFVAALKKIGRSTVLRSAAKTALLAFDFSSEIEVLGHPAKRAFACVCGVGKTNAAFFSALLTQTHGCGFLVNVGMAGLIDSRTKLGIPLLIDKVAYHDVDLTAFGYEPGKLPNTGAWFDLRTPALRLLGERLDGLGVEHATKSAATGDRFVTKNDVPALRKTARGVSVVDMELGAIAHVCALAKTRLLAVKFGSDRVLEQGNESAFAAAKGNYAKTVAPLIKALLP